MAAQPCLVLLGEPGIGKSFATRSEFERCEAATGQGSQDRVLWFDLRTFGTEDRFVRSVFEGPAVAEWKAGGSKLFLFLDSLDEGLLRIDVLAALLAEQLATLPVERLFLRLACRTAQWPAALELELKRLWKNERFSAVELVPLAREDVQAAANKHGIDGSQFVADVIAKDVVPLAIKPITLEFLLRTFANSRSLPADKKDLYEKGCRILCEEISRRGSKLSGSLTAQERLQLAERVAAVTVFGNRYAIWIGSEASNVPIEDVLLRELAGGMEDVRGNLLQVREEGILEALGTGLFSSRGLNRIGWAHQTYAEFLASQYLIRRSVKLSQLLSLITSPDDPERRIVPQLEETVAWLASNRPDLFDVLVRRDPENIVRGDILQLDEGRRRALVDALLVFYEEGRGIDDDWGLRKHWRKLSHPGLADQLRPFISDRAKNFIARRVSAEIAGACGCKALLDVLLDVALNPHDVITVRTHAVRAIRDIGDQATITRLLPLAKGELPNDSDDELKGISLTALWPDHIDSSQLFEYVTPPRRSNLLGAYRMFLHQLAKTLRLNDIPEGLSWVERNQSRHGGPSSFDNLADEIMYAAWRQAATVEDYTRFARVALIRLANYDSIIGRSITGRDHAQDFWDDVRTNSERRHRLARALVQAIENPEDQAYLIAGRFIAANSDDLPWMIEQLELAESEREKRVWSILITRLFDRTDPEQIDLVLNKAEANSFLHEEMAPLMQAVEIGSDQALRLKRLYEAERDVALPQPVLLDPSPEVRVENLLSRAESQDPCAFWPAVREMTLERESTYYGHAFEPDIRSYPVWQHATKELRARILAAGKAYVSHCDPKRDEWFLSENYHLPAAVGYQMLRLLAAEEPQFVATLPRPIWEKWSPVLLTFPMWEGADRKANSQLVCLALRHAESAVLSELRSLVTYQMQNDREIDVFQRFDECWTDALNLELRQLVQSNQVQPRAFEILLRVLFQHDSDWVETYARSLFSPIPTSEPDRIRAALAAALLLAHSPSSVWAEVWETLKRDAEFGKAIVLNVATRPRVRESDLRVRLSEDDLADLYLWMEQQWPHSDDPQHDEGGWVGPRDEVAPFRDSLLTALKEKGTFKASRAVERIADALPHLPWLRWTAVHARESARRRTWGPPTPREILELARNSEARLIQSGDDLLFAVLESLERLEAKLQGETPAAFALWDEVRFPKNPSGQPKSKAANSYRPKDENHLSDFIKIHLEEDLRGRGVLFNREVQIRRGEGIGLGENTDIHVDVVVPDKHGDAVARVCLIIEVKGCWNSELKTAMQTQLADRYLKQNQHCRHGIYVVGWFVCPQWDSDDYRQAATPNWSLNEAREYFTGQAKSIFRPEAHVRGFVLNTALR
jgi:predicted NACHT family NTPase